MRAPWNWRAKTSSSSAWRGRASRRAALRAARGACRGHRPQGARGAPAGGPEPGEGRRAAGARRPSRWRRSPAPRWSSCLRACPRPCRSCRPRARRACPWWRSSSWASGSCKGTVAAITGTKGKSTTTAALGAMLREAGGDVRVGGNIGQAVTGIVEGSTDDTMFVLEVSSFQLEGTDTFRPHVAVFLNLSADHLDRHASYEEYGQAKARIFANQTASDWAVVNADDPAVLALARQGKARPVAFHPAAPASRGRVLRRARARASRRRDHDEVLFDRADVRLPGEHLASDLLAAATAARLMGAPVDAIRRAVRSYTGVEHVLERVAEIARRRLLQRLQGHQRRGRAQEPGSLRRARARRSSAAATRAATSRTSRPPCARTARRCWPSASPRRASSQALAAVVPVVPCGSMREAVERGLRRWPRPATRCCWPPPARRSTCSRTTPRAAAPSRTRCGGWPRPPKRTRAWLRSSPRTASLFAVTVALLGRRPGDGVERVVRSGPGALRQRLPLPHPPGGVGLRRPRVHGGGDAHGLSQAAPSRPSCTRRWWPRSSC